jgi:hypothetical protein
VRGLNVANNETVHVTAPMKAAITKTIASEEKSRGNADEVTREYVPVRTDDWHACTHLFLLFTPLPGSFCFDLNSLVADLHFNCTLLLVCLSALMHSQ